ncbi:MAG: hypothetical protein N2C14_11750, partial [Planctomycetales bacterium]
DEYLDEDELETEFEGALGRLTRNHSKQQGVGKTIALISPSGGGGVSTITTNLGAGLAQVAGSCALFDLKLQTGDLAPLLNLRPPYTLAEFCHNIDQVDDELFEKCMARHHCGAALMAAPLAAADLDYVTLQGIRQGMNMACDNYPYLLADLDHHPSEEQNEVLQRADLVLLVMRMEFTGLRNTYRMLEYMQYLGINRDLIKIVVNRRGQPKEIPSSKTEKLLGKPIYHNIPDDPKSVQKANNCGCPVVLNSPRSRAARSLVELSRKLHAMCGAEDSLPAAASWTSRLFGKHAQKNGAGAPVEVGENTSPDGPHGVRAYRSPGATRWFDEHEAA